MLIKSHTGLVLLDRIHVNDFGIDGRLIMSMRGQVNSDFVKPVDSKKGSGVGARVICTAADQNLCKITGTYKT
jgi:hypothetical protein